MTRRSVILLALLVIVATVFIVRDALQGITGKRHRACIENLRDIEGAKEQYAFDHEGIAPADLAALVPDYLKRMPVCPAGGNYTPGDLQIVARCSIDTHRLPGDSP